MLFDTLDEGRRVPRVGTDRNMLGARIPPSTPADVNPDANGRVAPGKEGLSVSPDLKSMPLSLVPERLRDCRKGARGSNDLRLFRLGEGSFVQSPIVTDLELEPTSKTHGVVRPIKEMSVQEYQERLADTRQRWCDEG